MKPLPKVNRKHRSRIEALVMQHGDRRDRIAYQSMLHNGHGHLRKIQSLQAKIASRDELISGLQAQLAEERRERIYATSGTMSEVNHG